MVTLALDPVRNRADHARLRSHSHPVEATSRPILQDFNGHSLGEQAAVDLPNRFDIKYALPVTMLPELLEPHTATHTVLQIADQRVFTYENTYFDTPVWDLYRQHHNGKLNRYKYRYRHYLETDVGFLEMKVKTNKRRTLKRRIPWRCDYPIELPDAYSTLVANLYVNYRRITLWNRDTQERLTLDYDIFYRRLDAERKVALPDIVIAELKSADHIKRSAFLEQMKVLHYYPQSVSKYCIGVCITDDGSLKYNGFKSLISQLEQYSIH